MRRWLFLLPIIIFVVAYFVRSQYQLSPPSPNITPVTGQQIPTPTTIPTPVPKITLGLVGDLGLGRHITSTARKKDDFSWSFSEISPWLLDNEVTIANLESPIIKDCPYGPTGTFTFCGDEKFLPNLKLNRFILNLNNNHMLNYGVDGLAQTEDFLSTDYFYDDLFVKEINGTTFGFLGYDFITYPNQNKQKIIDAIIESKPKVDYLVVSVHWGNEYLEAPEQWRVTLAHQMIEAGADVIHGHHPHVWQGLERYQNGLIFYSFGNFIFDQSWSYETSHSQIARLTFTKGDPIEYQLFPIEILFNSQPRLMP